MPTQDLNPYLNFRDNARQAMEFYRSIFGGTLTMNTFGEFGQSSNHPVPHPEPSAALAIL